jgi:hypothetical protein
MKSSDVIVSNRWVGLLPITVSVTVAVGLTYVFWNALWAGGGLIGGDTYTYFFPQKVYLAERLAAGEFPLWNALVGHGYPLIGESQTAVLSPFNLVCYSLFDVNTAYNVVQLLHYGLAFVFTWLYARRFGVSASGSLLAALIFTYAWFPFRISLEWAITTGAWLPAALWCVESFLQTRWWRYAIGVSVVLALQLLAGHFNLAFLTHLTLAVYVPARLWFAKEDRDAVGSSSSRGLSLCIAAIFCGFALAAVQLLPTWELKTNSQRARVGERHDPGYGHTPVWYWSQVVAPWMWYDADIDINRNLPEGSPATNDIEAHLYFGIIPVLLLVYVVATRTIFDDRRLLLWGLIGLASLLYTPGWFLPITQYLPGFSFFIGPGRYSFLTTFAVAILTATGFDRLVESRSVTLQRVLFAGVFLGTLFDLLWVAGKVTNVAIVPEPALAQINESEVRRILQAESRPVRLFCRGANLPTLLGVASTPVYLGIGPAAYFDPATAMPNPLPFDEPPSAEQIEWLRRTGVTHMLSFTRLDETVWPMSFVWVGHDAFLNRAWENANNDGELRVTSSRANEIVIEASSQADGRIVLTDLAYPGWSATIDEKPAESIVVDDMYCGVDVPSWWHEVTWAYQPGSFRWGLIISAVTLLFLAGVAHVRFWHYS